MDPNQVADGHQMPDENYIERLFPKCPPNQQQIKNNNCINNNRNKSKHNSSSANTNNNNNTGSNSMKNSSINTNSVSNRRQPAGSQVARRHAKSKMQQQARRQLEARRNTLINGEPKTQSSTNDQPRVPSNKLSFQTRHGGGTQGNCHPCTSDSSDNDGCSSSRRKIRRANQSNQYVKDINDTKRDEPPNEQASQNRIQYRKHNRSRKNPNYTASQSLRLQLQRSQSVHTRLSNSTAGANDRAEDPKVVKANGQPAQESRSSPVTRGIVRSVSTYSSDLMNSNFMTHAPEQQSPQVISTSRQIKFRTGPALSPGEMKPGLASELANPRSIVKSDANQDVAMGSSCESGVANNPLVIPLAKSGMPTSRKPNSQSIDDRGQMDTMGKLVDYGGLDSVEIETGASYSNGENQRQQITADQRDQLKCPLAAPLMDAIGKDSIPNPTIKDASHSTLNIIHASNDNITTELDNNKPKFSNDIDGNNDDDLLLLDPDKETTEIFPKKTDDDRFINLFVYDSATNQTLQQSRIEAAPEPQDQPLKANKNANLDERVNIVSVYHRDSEQLLSSDFNDEGIVRNDASTDELCNIGEWTEEATSSTKDPSRASCLVPTISTLPSNVEPPNLSHSNKLLGHRSPSSSSLILGLGHSLQTVDEQSEINVESDNEASNTRLLQEDSERENKFSEAEGKMSGLTNPARKTFVPPGRPQRIRPQSSDNESPVHDRFPNPETGNFERPGNGKNPTLVEGVTESVKEEGLLARVQHEASVQRTCRQESGLRVKFVDDEKLVKVREDSGSITESNQKFEPQTQSHHQQSEQSFNFEPEDLASSLNKISLTSASASETMTLGVGKVLRETVPPVSSDASSCHEPSTVSPLTTLRHHKLPNETSHFSVIRGSHSLVMADPVSSSQTQAETKMPAPPRSASIQFNTLSDNESGSDEYPSSGKPNLQPQLYAPDALRTGLSSAAKRVEVAAEDSTTCGGSSNQNDLSNSNSRSNIDDDLAPNTKTALIFPRLDEGLSSEAESNEEDAEDEDERAMDADVDADDDDDNDEDEDDDDDDVEDDDDDDDDDDDEDDDEDLARRNSDQLRPMASRALGSQSMEPLGHSSLMANMGDWNLRQQHQSIDGLRRNQGKAFSVLQHQPLSLMDDSNQQASKGQTFGQYGAGAAHQQQTDLSMAHDDIKSMANYQHQNGQSSYWMSGLPAQQQQHQQSASSSSQLLGSSRFHGNGNSSHTTNTLAGPMTKGFGGRVSGSTTVINNNNNNNNNNGTTGNTNHRDEVNKVTNRLSSDTDNETDRLLGSHRSDQLKSMVGNSCEILEGSMSQHANGSHSAAEPGSTVMKQNSKEVLIEGVLFNVKYLGSTHSNCEGRSEKEDRIQQAEMAVQEVKIRNGESQTLPIEVQLFISTEKIMVLDDKERKIMMDHSLRTISYIADIGEAIVLIVRKKNPMPVDAVGQTVDQLGARPSSKISCHVFESKESHTITKSISQAFQVAYTELLKANGNGDAASYLPKELDYQEVLNSQEMSTDELEMFARKENQREVIVPKEEGEILGLSIVESGWGSVLPTVVIANLKHDGPAYRCKKLSIGDQILSINGISLVGLPLSECQEILRKTKSQRVARLSVVPCPITVEVKIKRPDTKYQLGFSVQNGVICSLLRGGIAERGGVRVGHRIMSINGTTVVGVPHEKIVTLLASSVGEIRMKTCLTSLYRLILGEENPVHF